VSDIVDANLACLDRRAEGVFNVGGGSRVTLAHVLGVLERVIGEPLQIERADRQAGDVEHTEADTGRAESELGYAPKVSLEDGLRAHVASLR
jgi:nucleoside-diphosphate-sugar epimerase